MDLHFDARFEGRLIYGNEGQGCIGRASDSLTSFRAGAMLPLLGISTVHAGTLGEGLVYGGPSSSPASFRVR